MSGFTEQKDSIGDVEITLQGSQQTQDIITPVDSSNTDSILLWELKE